LGIGDGNGNGNGGGIGNGGGLGNGNGKGAELGIGKCRRESGFTIPILHPPILKWGRKNESKKHSKSIHHKNIGRNISNVGESGEKKYSEIRSRGSAQPISNCFEK